MKSQRARCHLSKQALLKVASGDTVTASEMLPAVYGRDAVMSLSEPWRSRDRCSLTYCTYTDLLPSLQYSIVYPFSPESPMVSGVFHLMVRLESFTSSTDTSRGALVGTDGGSNRVIYWLVEGDKRNMSWNCNEITHKMDSLSASILCAGL